MAWTRGLAGTIPAGPGQYAAIFEEVGANTTNLPKGNVSWLSVVLLHMQGAGLSQIFGERGIQGLPGIIVAADTGLTLASGPMADVLASEGRIRQVSRRGISHWPSRQTTSSPDVDWSCRQGGQCALKEWHPGGASLHYIFGDD